MLTRPEQIIFLRERLFGCRSSGSGRSGDPTRHLAALLDAW